MKISCIIIDDEPHALSLLEGYIAKIPALQLKGRYFDALEALEFLKKENADIIFTDINMPLLSGLELAEVLPRNQKFVFTTAFAEHAISSFSYNVVDYLLKPISLKRFIQAINKFTNVEAAGLGFDSKPGNIVFVKSGKKIVRTDLNQVLYIHGEKEYVSLHFEKDRLMVYKRMKEMEALLPANFTRIHLSFIINLDHLLKVEMNHAFVGGINIPISEFYREQFLHLLNQKLI